MSLPLDPEKGVNPRLTFCVRCGKDGPELVLIGRRNKVYRCGDCKTDIYGHGSTIETCPSCSGKGPHEFVREIGDDEKLPSTSLCESCQKEVDLHSSIVSEGGIYFKCSDCKQSGVIRASAKLAGLVREKLGVKAPEPCGVQFTKADGCPACGERPEVSA